MNKKSKNPNSILVLATLGVYLGLILSGGTPQVLASAAMARTFDIQDEIERRDDLDNKPDDERSPATAPVLLDLKDVQRFLTSTGLQSTSALEADYSYSLNTNELAARFALKKSSPERSLELTQRSAGIIRMYRSGSDAASRQKIIDNTSFSTENDQVFLITHLPRAGLASL